MTKALESTVALVTGASSGIGEATARALAAHGARVAAVARRGDRLEALTARIQADGGEALAVEADVTDEAHARDAVERTVAKFGRLDTLVNNAGVMLLGPIVGADVTEWQRMLDLNVSGLMYMAHAALPHLIRAAADSPRKVADLVNVSSIAGRAARNGAGVYNASKFAVGAFSESLRQEITKKFVRICIVEPGYVESELRSHNRPEIQDQMAKTLVIDDPLQPDDIADAIAYVVTRARHIAINEILIRPTEQER
jgi:NADP-dependent 3-hydroxy acid dehydrogenase YdfG